MTRPEQIGIRLKALRNGKPSREVANAVNISTSALHMYESGRRVPRDEVKERLAEYYGASVQDLFFTPVEHN